MNGIDLATLMGAAGGQAPPPAEGSTFGFGTVTSVSPLRVYVTASDAAAVTSTPITLVDCQVGDRVRWELTPSRQLLVVGVVGGTARDSGVVSLATAGFTAATNFSTLSGSARRLNGFAHVTFAITTTNAIAAGNISNTGMINIPAGWEPSAGVTGVVTPGAAGDIWSGYAAGSSITMAATVNGFAAGAAFNGNGIWSLA